MKICAASAAAPNCSLETRSLSRTAPKFPGMGCPERVRAPSARLRGFARDAVEESGCLGLQPKAGGKFHLRLNTGERPIANKYCEGKMKRTLKRELKSA